jgi:acetamidase/formamidase
MRTLHLISTVAVAVSALALHAAGPATTPAVHVRSTPDNVVLGVFPIDRAPVAKVASGDVVRVDTLSQRGATQQEDPVTFLGKFGVKPDEVLQDVKDLWTARNAKPANERGGGGHILTGPIYVDGAEPGDTLAVEMVDITTRVPYGINSTSSTSGVFSASYPGTQGEPIPVMEIPNTNHLIRTGVENGRPVAFFADNIRVPMHPFFGTMAVAPDHPTVGQPGVRVEGLQTSGPPGAYGGNMDFRDLKAGSTLYLPVFHTGALFYVGDPHGTQGDGEVSGNAIEQSLTGVLRFTVLKGKAISGPRAEDATHYYIMGIDLDLDRAMRKAVAETVDFLVKEKGLTPPKALSLCSIAIDFRIAEVVDTTQVIVGSIPKALFR